MFVQKQKRALKTVFHSYLLDLINNLALLLVVMRKSGFVVTDARMEYYGYCRDCLKRPG